MSKKTKNENPIFGAKATDLTGTEEEILNQIIKKFLTCESIKQTALALNTSIHLVRKMLISAGIYSTPRSIQVQKLFDEGLTLSEIAAQLKLSRGYVDSLLPYTRGCYLRADKTYNAFSVRRSKAKHNPGKIQDSYAAQTFYSPEEFEKIKNEHCKKQYEVLKKKIATLSPEEQKQLRLKQNLKIQQWYAERKQKEAALPPAEQERLQLERRLKWQKYNAARREREAKLPPEEQERLRLERQARNRKSNETRKQKQKEQQS